MSFWRLNVCGSVRCAPVLLIGEHFQEGQVIKYSAVLCGPLITFHNDILCWDVLSVIFRSRPSSQIAKTTIVESVFFGGLFSGQDWKVFISGWHRKQTSGPVRHGPDCVHLHSASNSRRPHCWHSASGGVAARTWKWLKREEHGGAEGNVL